MVDYISVTNNIVSWMTWILIAAVVIVGIIFFLNMLKFKHRVVVKKLGKNGTIVIVDKAKEVNTKGRKSWKLQKLKEHIPIPPTTAWQITNKGKTFVEAYRTPQGEYVYNEDNTNMSQEDIQNDPIKSSDREFLVSQWQLAEEYRTKTWKDFLPQMMPFLAFIIFVVLVFAFWGQIMQPSKAMVNTMSQTMKEQKQTQSLINEALGQMNCTVNKGMGDFPEPPSDLPVPPN